LTITRKKRAFPIRRYIMRILPACSGPGSRREIDAMVSDELRVLSDEVIIDKFDRQDIYVMVKKGNTELLHTIDEAIRKLNMADPGWNLDLKKKYFLSDYSASFSMTPAEIKYVESLTSSGKKLRVLFNPARYPFSYYKDGEAAGVLVDIFRNIAADYGCRTSLSRPTAQMRIISCVRTTKRISFSISSNLQTRRRSSDTV
jgi:hypothetical protein